MTTRKAQIDATMNATGVVAGAAEAAKSVKGLATTAKESGREIGDAIEGAGKRTRSEADKIAADTKRAADSIQRAIAQMEAAGKGKSAFFEQLYSQRGIDTNALRPLLDQLAEVEARQKKAAVSATAFAGGTDAAAKSAAQLSYQLRQVGPQFTDIVTSLASGQAPLTVLIQQGGQLKDVFGGIGPAARALGGYLLSLINPYTVAAAAIAAIGYAYNRGAQEEKEFTKAILLSGNAAGVTSNQLAGMASSLKNITGSQAAAAEALTLFVRAGDVGAKNLEKFAASALLFEKTTGQAVSETVKQFEALKKAPLEASVKLNEATGFLTDSVYRQIKALEEQGKTAEAAALAQNTLADANDKISQKLIDNAGSIERAWDAVVKVFKRVGSAILDIGRPEASTEAVKRLEAQIKQIENSGAGGGGKAGAFGAFQGDSRQLNALREQLDNVRQIAAAEALGAKAQAEAVERSKLRIKFEEDLARNAEKRKKADIEIAEVIALQTRNIITQAEATTRIGQIREKYKESAGPKDNSVARDAEAQRRAVAEALGVTADYVETLGRYQRARDAGTLSDEAYTKAILDLIKAQSSSKEIAKQQADAQKEQERVLKNRAAITADAQSAIAKSVEAEYAALDAIDKSIEAERERVAVIGLTAGQIRVRTLATIDGKIAAKEAELGDVQLNDNSEIRIRLLGQEIEKLRERRRLLVAGNDAQGALDAEKAMKDAAQSAASEWQKASDQISQSLSDSLFRAAEAGKGFFQTLRDSIKGMFNNLILRPIIQAGFSGAVGAVGGALGLASPASAAASDFNGLGALGSLGGLFGAGTGIGGAATTFATSGLGTLLGLSETVGGVGVGLTGAGSGLVSALTAIPVWGWAAMAAVAVAAIFGGKKGGPKTVGEAAVGVDSGPEMFGSAANPAIDTGGTLRRSIDSILLETNAIGAALGGASFGGGIRLGFDQDPQGTAQSRIASRVYGSSGQITLDSVREVGRDSEQFVAEMSLELKRIMVASLKATDLSFGFNEFFAKIDPLTADSATLDSLMATARALIQVGENAKLLPGAMGALAISSAAAREKILTLVGGIDSLNQLQASYFQNFFSPEEQLAQMRKNAGATFQNMGLSFEALLADPRGPIMAFRSLVEGLKDASGQIPLENAAAFAALQRANPEVVAFVNGTNQIAEATRAAAEASRNAADSIDKAFLSDTDYLAKAMRDLGFAVPQTAAEFEALTRAQSTSTDAGRQTIATLLGLKTIFDSLQAAAKAAAEAAKSAADSIDQAFLSGADYLAKSVRELGFAMPQTAAEFESLVRAQDTTTESGRNTIAALLGLKSSFESVEAAAREAANAVIRMALESSRAAVTTEMDALARANGDLTRTLFELENPIRTTADRFVGLGQTMQGMLDRMAQILGTGSLSLLDQLQAAVNTRTGIASARAGVAGTIEGLQIQGFQNRGDLTGGVAFLRNLERAAFAELQTTSDPAGVAGKITNLITQRYQLEAQLISGAGSARQTALQDEIATLEQMASIADQLKSTILDLKTGSLSALAPQDQVAAASAAYGDTLSRARAGDVKALQALPGMATQFLTEQQSFDASGGSYGATFTGVLADLESVGASLSGVPTQLSLAQAQLTETGIVVDNTGAMAADLQSIDTALTVRSEAQEAGIEALVVAIRAQITSMDGEREALRAQWGREADRWAALGLTLEGIEASIRTLSENATLAAAA